MTPFYADNWLTLYEGDLRAILRELPADSVDACITSPPYHGLRSYGTTPQVWHDDMSCADEQHEWGPQQRGRRKDVKAADETTLTARLSTNERQEDAPIDGGRFCLNCNAWLGELGHEPTYDLYVRHIVQAMESIWRVLRPTGSLWLNIGFNFAGEGNDPGSIASEKQLMLMPFYVAELMQRAGWTLRNVVVWHKANHMPTSISDRLALSWEPVMHFVKQPVGYFYDLDAIREPHAESSYKRLSQAKALSGEQLGGAKQHDPRSGIQPGEGAKTANRLAVKLASNPQPNGRSAFRTGGEFAEAFADGTALHPAGKNPGDVWKIPTQAWPDAHFAVFPEELVRRPILATVPREVCQTCLDPRRRITEKAATGRKRTGPAVRGAVPGMNRVENRADWQEGVERRTVGWTDCGHGNFAPGVVLDPFMGTGTTLRVAQSLSRRGIGIDLNREYIEQAMGRNAQTPLGLEV